MKILDIAIDAVQAIIALIVIVAVLAIMIRAINAPVVFKDLNGEICGCAGPDFPEPSKEACKTCDLDGFHEVIKVSQCKEVTE